MKNEVSGHWKKLVSDPKYLGAADLEGMPEIAGTIAATAKEMVQNASGKAEKTVLHFVENIKPLVLNATNSKIIAKLAGTPMVEGWKGTRIQIYYDPKVKFAGDMVGGVRVRPYPPREGIGTISGKPVPCENCGANIKPFGKMSTEQVAAHTKAKYGKALCSDCATEFAAKKQEESMEQEESKE